MRALEKENIALKHDSFLKNEMVRPLKNQLNLYESRIKEYEVRGPPKNKIDVHLVCTGNYKRSEELNLLAKLNDAVTYC